MTNLTNSSQIENIVQNTNWNKIADYLSFLAQKITDKLVEFLGSRGFNVSQRWSSFIIFFIALLIIYGGIKISKPIIKYILLVLGIWIVAGMILAPNW